MVNVGRSYTVQRAKSNKYSFFQRLFYMGQKEKMTTAESANLQLNYLSCQNPFIPL